VQDCAAISATASFLLRVMCVNFRQRFFMLIKNAERRFKTRCYLKSELRENSIHMKQQIKVTPMSNYKASCSTIWTGYNICWQTMV